MKPTPALVIAAHGTRVAAGVEHCHQLVALVAEQLPGVDVSTGFVELVEPSIHEAVADALADHDHVVVVPLMVGTGAHVRVDIPREVREGSPDAHRVVQTPHLGPHALLLEALDERLESALTGAEPVEVAGRQAWTEEETTVVLLGRGSLVAQANADHCALARMVHERHHLQRVLPGFIQVTDPSLPEALDQAAALGARRIVVLPNFLFAGRLEKWLDEQTTAWAQANPAVEVRTAGIIGPCHQLAGVVATRYRDAASDLAASALSGAADGSPVYLTGLDLRGRRVLVAGAGKVAARRVVRLLEAGAEVTVVAPEADERIVGWAEAGRLDWRQRPVAAADVAGCAYVLACTDDPATNELVTDAAVAANTFCVRADDATRGTAWTPATERVGSFTVGVVGNRDPRGSAALRDRVVATLFQLDDPDVEA